MPILTSSIFFSLCALLFWLPIPLGSFRPWAIMLFGFAVTIVFITHLLNAFLGEKPLLPKKHSLFVIAPLSITLAVLAFQLLPLSTQSVDPNQTFIMFLKTVTMLMLTWLMFVYCDTKTRVKHLVYAIIAAGLVQALYATYLTLSPNSLSWVFSFKHSDRAMGSFTYQNFLANYLALTLALGMGLLVSELKLGQGSLNWRNRIRDIFAVFLSTKLILRLSLILMIVGLILTKSRMGNSAFFIALAIVSCFAFFFYKNKPKNLRLLIISFFIVDLIIVGAMFGVEKVKQRLVETSLSNESRDEVIKDSLPLILDNPILGSGGGSFYTAFLKYQQSAYSGFYNNAHNDYLQFAIELGIPTTLLLGIMLIVCLFLCAHTMIKRSDPLFQGIAFGCAIAIIHMLLHSSVDFSLQAGANSMTFIVILCLAVIANKLPSKRKKRRYS